VVERKPVVKRSCSFCISEQRDELDEALKNGETSCQRIDKEMGWRANTADRHFRNHMGQYHMASNTSCVLCTHENRASFEHRFFSNGSESDLIAEELGISRAQVSKVVTELRKVGINLQKKRRENPIEVFIREDLKLEPKA
jgi:hypothetical protein